MTDSQKERLKSVREALKHPAEIYDSWASTNGNPMMIANPEKCKLSKDAIQILNEILGEDERGQR